MKCSIAVRTLFSKINKARAPQPDTDFEEPDMTDLFDNPIGLDGFEFVEFCAPEKGVLEPVFQAMGFTHLANHRSKDVQLWRQGGINLLANYEPRSAAWYFAREHGPSACGMAFRVKDAAKAYDELLERGAEPVEVQTGPMELRIPAIRGIGGAILYLVDRYSAKERPNEGDTLSIYDIDFEYLPDVDRNPEGAGFLRIDHLTHNVHAGRMAYWADYYETLFNFQEIRFFDIKGEYTGLTSKALTAPDGKIKIPLNEEGEGGKGQIEEFLREFNGEGIQHIALICDDLVAAWDRLKEFGVPFMTAPPETYYEMLSERLPGHGEPEGELKTRGILLDGTTEGGEPRLLLQIFAEAQVGPVFFEFIQRKGDDGFGEGNFKALFESIERDQVARGVLDTKQAEPAE
jgi:4-hydroxyphenylpyruvate dioxygenase